MRAVLALAMLGCVSVGNASGQYPSVPDSCGAEILDLAGMVACRRLTEERRDQRCAAPAKARILPPTGGARVLNFGERTQHGTTSKGVVFQVVGPTVVAPSAGRVLFAGSFRTHGNIVVIDSCNVDVLVSGMKTVATHAQALVGEGQAIGSIEDPGSVVYLEVRRANRPIDPFGSLTD